MAKRRGTTPYPDPPPHLSERSAALWRELGPAHCTETGRRVLLEQALRSLDQAKAAQDILRSEGLTVVTARSGVAHAHPMIRVQADAHREFFRAWTALGLQYCREGII